MLRINGETHLYPIIGDPIIYVKSPEWLSLSFAAKNYNAVCVPMQVKAEDLEAVMTGLSCIPNVRGLLVTMPHKFRCFEFCATASKPSKLFGVVSVMRRNNDASWHGDMLDGLAFVKAQINNGAKPENARALLLGAGGAGSAIALALLEFGVRELIIHDTNQERVEALIQNIATPNQQARVAYGPPDPTGFDMVCNATPLGMNHNDPLPLNTNLLNEKMFVGDVIAGHGQTKFLAAAQAAGCRTANGDEMVLAVQDLMLSFFLGA